MKISQKEMDEFALDLVEFLGKHFHAYFDRTKVGGGSEGVSVSMRRQAAGSELELSTEGGRIQMRFGPAVKRFPLAHSREKLFSLVLTDLIDVFENRLVLVTGRRAQGDGRTVTGLYRDLEEARALDHFRLEHPDCESATLVKWSDKRPG